MRSILFQETPNGDIKPPSSLPELKKEKSALKTPTKKISPKSPEVGSTQSLGGEKKSMLIFLT